jgi:4-hydroxy-tetrahydrodipicolinate synthase
MIADKSPVPVLLYNVPGRTGTNVSAQTVLELAKHPNIFGIKEASGDLNQCLDIIKGKPTDFMLISGDDILTVPMISIGAEGVISVLANAYPQSFSKTINLALEGNFKEATSNLTSFLDINDLLYKESNPVGIKEVMNLQGTCNTAVRPPLFTASEGLKKEIKEQFEILG